MTLGYGFGLGLRVARAPAMDWRQIYAIDGVFPDWVYDFQRQRYGNHVPVPMAQILSFSRTSPASYFDAQKQLAVAAADTPRFTHDPQSGETRGLIVEHSTTNLLHDAVANAALWRGSVDRADLSLNAMGYFDGVRLASGGARWHRATIDTVSLTAGMQYSVTLFFQLGSSGQFRMDFRNSATGATSQMRGTPDNPEVTGGTGAYSAIEITGMNNGVYRLTAQFMPSESGNYGLNLGPNSAISGETVIGLGAQVEQGGVSSFYPGDGTNMTRAADQVGTVGITGTFDVVIVDDTGFETSLPNQYITDGWWPSLSKTIIGQLRLYPPGTIAGT